MYGIKELWNWNYIVRSKRANKKKKISSKSNGYHISFAVSRYEPIVRHDGSKDITDGNDTG
jgi:hypothetical protein